MPGPSNLPGRPRDPEIDAAVLAATRALLVEVGYQKLTFRAVAERACSNRPALYRRWPSKAHLVYDAVFPSGVPEPDAAPDRFVDELRQRIERILASYGRPEAREAAPGLLADLRDLALRDSVVEGLQQQARAEFAARVARAVAEGEVRPGVDSDVLLDTVHAAAMQHAIGRQAPDPAFADRLLELVCAGVLTDPR